MRVLSYVLISFLCVTITSCSKSDDEEPTQQQQQQGDPDPDPDPSIIGTWTINSLAMDFYQVTTFPNGATDITTAVAEGYDLDFTVTYGENPNLSTTNGTYAFELTTMFSSGSTIVENYEGQSFINFTGAWDLDGDQLIISNQVSNGIGTISVLSETTLNYVYVVIEESQQGDNTIVNTITATYSFSR